MDTWMRELDEWKIFGFVFIVLLCAAELGFRMARKAALHENGGLGEVSAIQGAVLGLLALLLGFTFSVAATRFDARKELIRDEANAIGTVLLRTQLLQEPQRSNVLRLMVPYVDTRFDLQKIGFEPEGLASVNAKTAKLQDGLWTEATAAAAREPQSIMTGLFIASLNDMIDMHGKEVASMRNRIPTAIFLLLFLVAIVAVGLTGYGSGPVHRRSFTLTFLVSLLVTAVIALIVDLHRPARGVIEVDLSSMVDVRDGLRPPPR